MGQKIRENKQMCNGEKQSMNEKTQKNRIPFWRNIKGGSVSLYFAEYDFVSYIYDHSHFHVILLWNGKMEWDGKTEIYRSC